ncbi:hypothetical protein AAC387_Pa06g2078 [Persea americana]
MALPRTPASAESQWKKTTGLTRTQHGVSSSNPIKSAESSPCSTLHMLFDNIDDGSNTIVVNARRNRSLVEEEQKVREQLAVGNSRPTNENRLTVRDAISDGDIDVITRISRDYTLNLNPQRLEEFHANNV